MSDNESVLDFTEDLENFEGMQAVPGGEYTLLAEFAEVKEGTNKNGEDYKFINVRYSIPEAPEALPVYYTVWLPTPEQNAQRRARTLDGLKKFLDLHGLGFAFTVDEIRGVQVDAILEEEEYEGEARNKIKRFVSGR